MAGSRSSSSVIRKLPPSISALLSCVLALSSGGLSPGGDSVHQQLPRFAEPAKQPWQKQSFSVPFIEVEGSAFIGPAWGMWPSLNQSVVIGMRFTDRLGWSHMPELEMRPLSFEPHHLRVRKEGPSRETRKEEMEAGQVGTAHGHSLCMVRRASLFQISFMKYNLHPIKFTTFRVQLNKFWQNDAVGWPPILM